MKTESCLSATGHAVVLTCLVAVLAGTPSCVTCPSASVAAASTLEARGVFVRHIRVRLAPAHTQRFEGLLTACVAAARGARLPAAEEWLCYREPPGRYWLLWMSPEREGFPFQAGADPVLAFVRHIGGLLDRRVRDDLRRRLSRITYEVEWALLLRQKRAWSTVEGMSTASHPKARLMERGIQPGREPEFERALTARTAFLGDHGYPLPIEGFVTLTGAPGMAHQVVFPVDWPGFHATQSFGAFVRGLDAAARAGYARRKQALMKTMNRAEWYDASHAPELSYPAARQ